MTVPTPPSSALSLVPGAEAAAPAETVPATGASSQTTVAAMTAPGIRAFRTATAALPPIRHPDPDPAGDGVPAAPDPAFADGPPSRLRPSRLRIGWHTLHLESRAQQAWNSNTPGGVAPLSRLDHGLILGRDVTGAPVTIPAFSPEPVRLTLIGGHRLAQILLLRALALGAAAVVVSADPPAWQGFGRNATCEADRVVVLGEDRSITAFGTAEQPALVLYDLHTAGPATAPQPGPWQTRLTVLRTLTEAARPHTEDCHFLLVQDPDGADTLALVRDGLTHRVHITPTPTERRAFGG